MTVQDFSAIRPSPVIGSLLGVPDGQGVDRDDVVALYTSTVRGPLNLPVHV